MKVVSAFGCYFHVCDWVNFVAIDATYMAYGFELKPIDCGYGYWHVSENDGKVELIGSVYHLSINVEDYTKLVSGV